MFKRLYENFIYNRQIARLDKLAVTLTEMIRDDVPIEAQEAINEVLDAVYDVKSQLKQEKDNNV